MQPAPARSRILKFGVFTVDLEAGELHKAGVRQKLAGQPFEVLIALLERPQQVVTREELQQRIWPTNTFVDYDLALRKAIARLRDALGDSSENPRFIETIPRKGYRFIAPVTWDGCNPGTTATNEPADGQTEPIQPVSIKPMLQVVALIGLIVFVGLAYWVVKHFLPTRLTEKDTVVVADFVNTTGDPIFDDTLRQGLSSQLEQSPFLNLLSDDRIAETLVLMGHSKQEHLTHDLVREVCQRTGSEATIEGFISNLGSQYVLGMKAVNCRSGNVLAEHQATAARKERVLDALDQIATKLREKLGEKPTTLQEFNKPLQQVTTPNLEALKAYSLGHEAMETQVDAPSSIRLFQRAIDLDPNFAMAYARLATDYDNLDETALAAENAKRAYNLRDHVSEREKLYISSHYEDYVTGNLEAALRTYEVWRQTYPHDPIPPANLDVIYSLLGDYVKALDMRQKAFELDPGSGASYANLVNAYLHLNRLEDARATAQKAQEHQFNSPFIHLNLYEVDFLSHDVDGMKREATAVMNQQGYESLMLYLESDTAAYSGQFNKARELTKSAVEIAQRNEEKEAGAEYEIDSGLREAVVGNSVLARNQALAVLQASNSKDAEAVSAVVLGLTGSRERAIQLADDLARRFPEDTIVQQEYLPSIHAAAVLGNHEKPSIALELLRVAEPYELGLLGVNFSLYPPYLRGLAYLAARQGDAAALEFQKILDHPGVVVNAPIGALAHLGLGRAHALANDLPKAKAEYEIFFSIWKGADPDIPVLQQAKDEYANL